MKYVPTDYTLFSRRAIWFLRVHLRLLRQKSPKDTLQTNVNNTADHPRPLHVVECNTSAYFSPSKEVLMASAQVPNIVNHSRCETTVNKYTEVGLDVRVLTKLKEAARVPNWNRREYTRLFRISSVKSPKPMPKRNVLNQNPEALFIQLFSTFTNPLT